MAKEGNKILLLSEKALDCKPYNTIDAKVTWNTCSLRKWINSTFLNTAFSIKEQKCIVSTLVSADKNPGNDIDPGNATTDKVFLLSITEVNKYLKYISSVEARKCVPTTYAVASGAYTSNSYTKGGVATCWWWLRSPGDYRNCAALINYDGSGRYLGTFVNSVRGCVRPALWIAIDSFVPDGRSSRAEIIQKDDPIIEVGDTYTFGTYEQGLTKDKEAIEWIVLEKAGNKILVVSKRGLDCKPYNTTNTNVTWETCSLRKWMNNTFLNAAFSAVEQEHIVSTSVSADENSKCSIKPGNVTMDKVFLLSITEVNKYLDSDYTRKCVPTYYAKANGVQTSIIDTKGGGGGGATCGWWLRSPGFNQNLAAGVGSDGSVSSYGSSVYINDCVRPALWINLDS